MNIQFSSQSSKNRTKLQPIIYIRTIYLSFFTITTIGNSDIVQ